MVQAARGSMPVCRWSHPATAGIETAALTVPSRQRVVAADADKRRYMAGSFVSAEFYGRIRRMGADRDLELCAC